MKLLVLSVLWSVSCLVGPGISLAQVTLAQSKPERLKTVDSYRARVLTRNGNRYSGLLNDVTSSYLYLTDQPYGGRFRRQYVPLDEIRKVTLRQTRQSSALLTGAVLGALTTGYLASQSLKANQPRSPVGYVLTLTFAAAGGAAGGLLVGSAVGRFSRRVVRPLDSTDPATSLFRQLEPFCVRYQEDILNRPPQTVP